jgi:hypothetical protein
MQLYARNLMVVTAASAVLAVGVVTTTPATSDFAAPRLLTTDVALTAGAGDGVGLVWSTVAAAVPAYAVTQAAILGADFVTVAADAIMVAATSAAAFGNSYPYYSYLFGVEKVLKSLYFWALSKRILDIPPLPDAAAIVTNPSVQVAVALLKADWTHLKNNAALAFSPTNFAAFAQRLVTPQVQPAASRPSRPTASPAARARAASVTTRQAPSAKAAAATAETAPTAEPGQRRAARGAEQGRRLARPVTRAVVGGCGNGRCGQP